MSFWLFLALIPLAVVAGLVAAKLAVRDLGTASSLLTAVPGVARDLLEREVDKVAAWNGHAVAPMAFVVFLWLASSGIHAVFDAMESETGSARPWWKKRLIALGACVLLSIGVALVALLGTGLDWIWTLTGGRLPQAAAIAEDSIVGKLGRLVLGAVVALGITSGIFLMGVPRRARQSMPILPGALLAVAIELILGLGYGAYVSRAGTGSAYQAGLAAIGVTMTAIYFFSLAILVGLELNVVLRDRRIQAPPC